MLCHKVNSMILCEFARRRSWLKSRCDQGLDLLPCEPKFISNWLCKLRMNERVVLKKPWCCVSGEVKFDLYQLV